MEDDIIFCYQCKMPVSIDSIGLVSGGCQPIPITANQRIKTKDSIRIPYVLLSRNTHWFLNWKIEEESEPESEPIDTP